MTPWSARSLSCMPTAPRVCGGDPSNPICDGLCASTKRMAKICWVCRNARAKKTWKGALEAAHEQTFIDDIVQNATLRRSSSLIWMACILCLTVARERGVRRSGSGLGCCLNGSDGRRMSVVIPSCFPMSAARSPVKPFLPANADGSPQPQSKSTPRRRGTRFVRGDPFVWFFRFFSGWDPHASLRHPTSCGSCDPGRRSPPP